MSTTKIRIHLADGDFLLRVGIRRVLEDLDYLTLEKAVQTGGEAITAAVAQEPDIVLMETLLPDMDGITAAREITDRLPATKIVMLSSATDRETMVRAYRAGATSYLVKDEVTQDLGPALRMIYRGSTILTLPPESPRLQSLLRAAHPFREALESHLTMRQKQLLTGVAEGKTNGELSRQLHFSTALVKADLSELMLRFGVKNRVQLAVLAVRIGLSA